MLNFLMLMAVPFLIALGVLLWFKGKVCLWEFFVHIGVVGVFVLICLGCAYWQNTTDQEIWNGMISDKRGHVYVSCSHSYPCNCRQESCGKDCTTTVCDTCYEHSNDWSWYLDATTNETLSIDRVDRQGNNMPPRWGKAYIGEPFSSVHNYTNYILANPDSVLLGGKGDVEKFKSLIPKYPIDVYDYYKHDPVVNMGVPNVDLGTWNWLIREVNKTLGPSKQVNINVILVKTDDPKYVLAFKDAWVGGKKNDADIIIASLDGRKIEFADVISWTPNAGYKIDLRDEIMRIGTLDQRDQIVQAIQRQTMTRFQRMHMKDFKYLMRSFQPSQFAMWVIFILAVLASIGFSVWSVINEFDEDDEWSYSKYGAGYDWLEKKWRFIRSIWDQLEEKRRKK